MERVIKFRGKRTDGKGWVYGYVLYLDTSIQIQEVYDVPPSQDAPLGDLVTEYNRVDPETVGQFTGLYDKKKTEVYEDDFVSDESFIYQVKWNNEMADFYLDPIRFIESENYPLCFESYKRLGEHIEILTVIGNIHENNKSE